MKKRTNSLGTLELSKLQAKAGHPRMSEPDFVTTSADYQEPRQKFLAPLSHTKVSDFYPPSPRRKIGGRLSDEEKKRLIASIPTRGVSTKPY